MHHRKESAVNKRFERGFNHSGESLMSITRKRGPKINYQVKTAETSVFRKQQHSGSLGY